MKLIRLEIRFLLTRVHPYDHLGLDEDLQAE